MAVYLGTDEVNLFGGQPSTNYQTKTITPTESSQQITPDAGYSALAEVDIDPISSTYVGSGITHRTSSDLTESGATVTAPSGYYENNATKTITSGSVTAPSTISGSSASVTVGTNLLTFSKTVSVTPNVTAAGYISSGTAGNSTVSLSSPITTKSAATYNPSTSDQTIASGTYLNGVQLIKAISLQHKTATSNGDVTADAGFTGLSKVTVNVAGGGGMNVQFVMNSVRVASSGYVATALTLEVAKTGTYNVSWSGTRSNTTGTSGSRLRINSTDQTAYTSFDSSNPYFQHIKMTGVSLTQGDTVTVYARSRTSSYYMTVANLIIEQTA